LGIVGILLFGGMLYHTYKDKREVIDLERKLRDSIAKDDIVKSFMQILSKA